MKPYCQYHADGRFWPAGKTILGLCAAWNHATLPYLPLTDTEHTRSYQYARAIRQRMDRLGYRYRIHYRELSTGALWPIQTMDEPEA